MPPIRCKLLYHSTSPHIQQLYTGFKMLRDDGLIDVTQEISKRTNNNNGPQHLRDAPNTHLRVEVTDKDNHKLMLSFDNHDSREIDRTLLRDCDVYFKRSFCRKYISKFHVEDKNKIYPLGLNYLVFPNSVDLLALLRNVSLLTSIRRNLGGIITSFDSRNKVIFRPRLRNLHFLPRYPLEPRVLFMVTAYDPYDHPDRDKEKFEERIHNNEVRANCVRMLRKELGPKFYGGFNHNKFTTKKYKDVLIDIPANAKKINYLKILEKFPICIATTGLHGSIGWKLAEYVAFSKAIISEKLQYEIPGQFCPKQNYLEFSSPEGCVEQSMKLLADHELRDQLMTNNSEYYQHYVKPDMLVFNALSIAIEKWK